MTLDSGNIRFMYNRGGTQDLCKFSLPLMPIRPYGLLRIHLPHTFLLSRSIVFVYDSYLSLSAYTAAAGWQVRD